MSKPVKVSILAGQSNMVGMGDVRTFDYIGEDPATAPMLKEMRGPDGKPRVCEKVWISSAITKRDESGNRVNGDGKPDLLTGKRLFGHDGKGESEWDPQFVFWYDIQGGRFERHVISFNHLQYYPGGENYNGPPQFACGTGMKIIAEDINGYGKVDILMAGRGGLYTFINRGTAPTPKSVHPKVPLMGQKRPDLN